MRIVDLWQRYGRRAPWVLEGLNLGLDRGQIAVVLGRNGVGKSTLLQVIAGVLPPTRGAIVDRPATVGWVPERFPAEQPFTARTYLERMIRMRGVDRSRDQAMAIGRWAERLYVERYLDVRLADLSKGSAQKVGLLQALIPEPDLIVLDEPWEGLDGHTRDQIPAIVAEIVARGGRVLISDHLGGIDRLAGAFPWWVGDGKVEVAEQVPLDDPTPDEGHWLVEVAVAAADAGAAAAQLRAAGHHVVGVRGEVNS